MPSTSRHSSTMHCRECYNGGALLDLGHVAGVESSSELCAAVRPAFVGAGNHCAVPDGTCLDGSPAWPRPDADIAMIGLQLSQRLGEGEHMDTRHTCSATCLGETTG